MSAAERKCALEAAACGAALPFAEEVAGEVSSDLTLSSMLPLSGC